MKRLIAFYLPQFHPTPENDAWWGKGFTEWTNVAQARPLYPGHYQPHVPADLGFYDLRVPETRMAQAELARQYGVLGFCYYEYWFGGRRILQRPFDEVLASREPDFPFCLCWANHSWSGVWHGAPDRTLIQQIYPGLDDHRRHFELWLRAFADDRYIRVDGCPLLLIHAPTDIPDVRRVTDYWRQLAAAAGLKGLHLVGVDPTFSWHPGMAGFDAAVSLKKPGPIRPRVTWARPIQRLRLWYAIRKQRPLTFLYEDLLPGFLQPPRDGVVTYPCALPNWDNTPRAGSGGVVFHGSTPALFRQHLKDVLRYPNGRTGDCDLVFLKAWNEWAEGNYVEPDQRFGHGYLRVIREELDGVAGDS